MSGVSGCFGSKKQDTIDNASEVDAAVEDILNNTQPVDGADIQSDAAVLIVKEYVRRLKLLTWAVGIIALVLLLKEVD